MNRANYGLALSTLLLLRAASPGQSLSAVAPQAATPILIELFTSEGCSSCPPADAWLQKIDASQPIPGAQAIVLSEHVDYWNQDGWKDPYSSAFFTERQSAYVRLLGSSSAYTPQTIVNGTTELQLSDQVGLNRILSKAAKAAQLPVNIGIVTVEGNSPTVLRAHIDADGTSSKHSADVVGVIALDHAESQVLHGENGGKRLSHASVALDLIRIGKLEKGKAFSQDFQTKIKPGVDPKNLRLIVFLQESGPGAVLGAALREVGNSAK
jgi:hypothetical protein